MAATSLAEVIVKRNDLQPIVTGTLTDSTGAVPNLTGASVKFVMRDQTATTAKVNHAATITNVSTGAVSYSWLAGDTDTAGYYVAEWVVTFSDGSSATFPTDGFITVQIAEDLDTATTSGRIVGLTEVKLHLNDPKGDRVNDVLLARYIDAARYVIEGLVGSVVPTQYTEFYDGGKPFVALRHRPVISVDAVTEYYGLGAYTLTNQPLGSQSDYFGYTVDLPRAKVIRRAMGSDAVLFIPGTENVKVTYTAGRSPTPDHIKYAACELVRFWWQQGQQGGSSTYMPGGGQAPDPAPIYGYAIPNRIREILLPDLQPPGFG